MGNVPHLGLNNDRLQQTKVWMELMAIVYVVRTWKIKDKESWLGRMDMNLREYSPWQIILLVLAGTHLASQTSLLLGLNAPFRSLRSEPDMHYSASFSFIRYLLTSLDAAVLSTMKVRIPIVKELLTIILSFYYLLFSRKAEIKVSQFQATVSTDAIKEMWNKGTNHPVLRVMQKVLSHPVQLEEQINIPRPEDGTAIECTLFFNGSKQELRVATRLLLHFPGGGFIAQAPADHADYLRIIAQRVPGMVILSVNYRKAPKYPFPAQFYDCFDVYRSVIRSNGQVIGMNIDDATSNSTHAASSYSAVASLSSSSSVAVLAPSPRPLDLALMGDSAGGNLVAAVTLRAISLGMPMPRGVHMVYPILDMSARIWKPQTHLPTEYQNRPRPRTIATTTLPLISSSAAAAALPLSSSFSLAPSSTDAVSSLPVESVNVNPPPRPAQFSSSSSSSTTSAAAAAATTTTTVASPSSAVSLAPIVTLRPPELTSRFKYHQDGVLPLKYIIVLGQAVFSGGGDPARDMYASPILAPDDLLSHFPPTFIHVGEVDPLYDDSINFAERLRQLQPALPVKVHVFPGCSHAYIHTSAIIPESKQAVDLSAHWINEIFSLPPAPPPPPGDKASQGKASSAAPQQPHQQQEQLLSSLPTSGIVQGGGGSDVCRSKL